MKNFIQKYPIFTSIIEIAIIIISGVYLISTLIQLSCLGLLYLFQNPAVSLAVTVSFLFGIIIGNNKQ